MSGIRLTSPVDGSVYVERPLASEGEVEAALAGAREAFVAWRLLSVEERVRRLEPAVDAMLALRDEIVPELAWQMGRPVKFGGGELGGFEERARHMLAIATDALAPVVPEPKPGFERYIAREPLGIVMVVAPWNYPYLTAVNSVIPALAAGNAVILKHAAQTTLVGERFEQALAAADLPAGLFRELKLSHAQTSALLGSGAIDRVNFTGSVEGGRAMEHSIAGRFKGAGLELGGKDPAYVRADADLAHAIENVADGAFFNSGQSCCGIERVYVDAGVFDSFVEGVVHAAEQYVLESPLEPETTLGPMVKPEAADFVRDQVDAAVAAGARALVDAGRFPRNRRGSAYLAPQVLVDVDHGMRVMTEESFGPVVGIMRVDSDEEAIERMNDSEYGLTASIWTGDVDAARSIGARIDTGTVFMNRADYLDPALAWTGVKDTGRGVTLSTLGYAALVRVKSYHLRTEFDGSS